jgi:NAD(P)-dependent dehydrogenase (short-subunit alcohol dehydrogenase family)
MSWAMVWGANGGIGRAIVKQLQDAGWNVIGVGHRFAENENLNVPLLTADAGNAREVAQAVAAASQETDAVDLFVYAVGDIVSEKVNASSAETWARIVDANLNGAFLTTHYSLPLLSPNAHLIFIGAVSEKMRLPGLGAYAAAKAGLEAFTDVLRKEERSKKITLVRPGAVATAFWNKVPFKLPPNAVTPDALARNILDLYQTGAHGTVDV